MRTKIEFEEVLEKRRPFGRFRADGTWDDEDDDARARQTKLAVMRFVMVTSSIVLAYLLLQLYFFGLQVNASDFNADDFTQSKHPSDSDTENTPS